MRNTRLHAGLVAIATLLVVATFVLPAVVAGASGETAGAPAGAEAQGMATPAPPEPTGSGVVNVSIFADDGTLNDTHPLSITVTNASTGDTTAEATTEDGWYPFIVAPGTYEVTTNATAYESVTLTVTVADREEVNVSFGGDLSIAEAIADNENDDGLIGDFEILQAIELWRTDGTVDDTGGKTIGDFKILELIEMWRDNTEV